MKRFNVSLLAVVAILAIGLTAFTKAENNAKRATVENCYEQLTSAYDPNDCSVNDILLQVAVPSTSCTIAQSQNGFGVRSVVAGSFKATTECDLVTDIFCCAQLIVDETPCPEQPLLNFRDETGALQVGQPAQISAIFCKD